LLRRNGVSHKRHLSELKAELLEHIGVTLLLLKEQYSDLEIQVMTLFPQNNTFLDIEGIINGVYEQNPKWNCILDVPEKPSGVVFDFHEFET
jgi:hypothetical protein